MIKGHTTIDLKNVKTGITERFEDDNIVTNALNKYFEDVGFFNINPMHTADIRNNLIPRLMGGVLLFDTQITANANNYICPSGVKMVGNGSYEVTSNDDVTEMGSYNSSESGWTPDGKFKMVWDYSTSQANGNINCVCLTSAAHGYIGEGNSTSGKVKASAMNDYSYARSSVEINIDGGLNQSQRIVHASRTTNTITMIDEHNLIKTVGFEDEHMSATGKIKLKTYKVPLQKIDMRFGAGQQYMAVTETEVVVPGAFLTALGSNTPTDYKKIGDTYIMACGYGTSDEYGGRLGYWNAGTSMHILRINADNTLSYFAIPNPESAQILFMRPSIIVSNDTLVIGEYGSASEKGTRFFDLDTPADNSREVLGSTLEQVDFIYPDLNVAQAASIKVDIGARKIYYNNSIRPTGIFSSGYNVLNDNRIASSYAGNGGIWKTTNYLATINNLDTQVVKTAEKTMKVTYILSFTDN